MRSLACSAFVSRGLLIWSFACAGECASIVHYVNANSTNGVPPYTNWTTAAAVIQDAVDVAEAGDVVLVTNGVYGTGGRPGVDGLGGSRVDVRIPITLLSVNGPEVTLINGYQPMDTYLGQSAIRCVRLTNGAFISGFTLASGAGHPSGGGLLGDGGTASNCVLSGNRAGWGGGGADGARLIDCVVTNNWCGPPGSGNTGGGIRGGSAERCWIAFNTAQRGGGAASSSLTNCVLWRNTANVPFYTGFTGGGAYECFLVNCTVVSNHTYAFGEGGVCWTWGYNNIVRYNTNDEQPYDRDSNYPCFNCCVPVVFGYVSLGDILGQESGGITDEPLFVDLAAGDLRLQPNSPCINSGRNDAITGASDLGGLPRVTNGTVDLGAYEYQGRGSCISYSWLQRYGFASDGSLDFADPDGDHMSNFQEWRCQTDPTNALSVLRMLAPLVTSTNVVVRWESVPLVTYVVERSVGSEKGFSFGVVSTNMLAQGPTTTYSDTNAPPTDQAVFYRVRVK